MRRALLALTATLALTACGGGSVDMKAADTYAKTNALTIIDDTYVALAQLTSIHVHAQVLLGNEPATIDFTSNKTGDGTGTVQLTSGTADVVVAGGKTYLKAPAPLWVGLFPKQADKLVGKWVVGLEPLQQVIQFYTLKGLGDAAKAGGMKKGKPTVVGTDVVDGVAVVKVQATDPATGAVETVSVAASPPHNVLRVEAPEVKTTLVFNNFNTPVTVTQPPAAEITTLAQAGITK